MPWEIHYTSRHNGRPTVHPHSHNQNNAQGWLETIHRENGGRATLIERDPNTGQTREIASIGDARDPLR